MPKAVIGGGRALANPPALASIPAGEVKANDDWYLMPYETLGPSGGLMHLRQSLIPTFRLRRATFVIVAISLLVGLGVGVAISYLHGPDYPSVAEQHTPPAAVSSLDRTPEKAQSQQPSKHVPNAEEMAKLKARNRRLEALIWVLRQRVDGPDKKPPQEPPTLLGQ